MSGSKAISDVREDKFHIVLGEMNDTFNDEIDEEHTYGAFDTSGRSSSSLKLTKTGGASIKDWADMKRRERNTVEAYASNDNCVQKTSSGRSRRSDLPSDKKTSVKETLSKRRELLKWLENDILEKKKFKEEKLIKSERNQRFYLASFFVVMILVIIVSWNTFNATPKETITHDTIDLSSSLESQSTKPIYLKSTSDSSSELTYLIFDDGSTVDVAYANNENFKNDRTSSMNNVPTEFTASEETKKPRVPAKSMLYKIKNFFNNRGRKAN